MSEQLLIDGHRIDYSRNVLILSKIIEVIPSKTDI